MERSRHNLTIAGGAFRWALSPVARKSVHWLAVLVLWISVSSCKGDDKGGNQATQAPPVDSGVALRDLRWGETLDQVRKDIWLSTTGRLKPQVFTTAIPDLSDHRIAKEREFWHTLFGEVLHGASPVVDTYGLEEGLESVRLILMYDEAGHLIRGCYVASNSVNVETLERADEQARRDRPQSEFTVVEKVRFSFVSREVLSDSPRGVGLCFTDKRAMEPAPQGGFRNVAWGVSPEALRMRLDASYKTTATSLKFGGIDDFESMVNWVVWDRVLGDDPEFPPLQFAPTWDMFRGRLGPTGGHIAAIEGPSVPFVALYDPSNAFVRACYIMGRSYQELLEAKYGRGYRQSDRTYWKTDDTVIEAAGSFGVPHTLCYTSTEYLRRMGQKKNEKQRSMSEGL
jgi:hypothetical protein